MTCCLILTIRISLTLYKLNAIDVNAEKFVTFNTSILSAETDWIH